MSIFIEACYCEIQRLCTVVNPLCSPIQGLGNFAGTDEMCLSSSWFILWLVSHVNI